MDCESVMLQRRKLACLGAIVVTVMLVGGCPNYLSGTSVDVNTVEIATATKLEDSSPTSKTASFLNVELKATDRSTLGTILDLSVTAHRTTDARGNPSTRVTVNGSFKKGKYCVRKPDGQRFAVVMMNAAGGAIQTVLTDPMPVLPQDSGSLAITGISTFYPALEYPTMAVVSVVPRFATWTQC